MKNEYSLTDLCAAFEVGTSGYYKAVRASKNPGKRKIRDLQLTEKILIIHSQSHGTYGAPRVYQMLKKENEKSSKKRVARIMRDEGIQGACARRKKPKNKASEPSLPPRENLLLNRQPPQSKNEVWAADITYIDTAEGWIYLAALKDLYSRRIVGWAISDSLDSSLVCDALQQALAMRHVKPGIILHSDQGCQYTSKQYADAIEVLSDLNALISMSRRGNCYDNAFVESGWGTLKIECVYRQRFNSHQEARIAIFNYINFYNHHRIHSSLGYLSPVDFENQTNITNPQKPQ